MGAFKRDLQILLYTPASQFAICCRFYECVLEEQPYYSWSDGPEDCGAKFHAGGGTISGLCQDHSGTAGPVMMNLETADVDDEFSRIRDIEGVQIIQKPVTKPYGTRCFSLRDPCGNQINLYHSNH